MSGDEVNREDTKEAIKVMQAAVDGETVQVSVNTNTWSDRNFNGDSFNPVWDLKCFKYRIKPKDPHIGFLILKNQISEIKAVELTDEVKACLEKEGIL